MAIFILLFIVMLLLIRPVPKPVDLVVVIDASASMGEPLAEITDTLIDLSENFPNIISDFRIGVVIYAQRFDNGVKIFDLQKMDEKPRANLKSMLEQVKAENSLVDINRGIQTGINLFGTDFSEKRRRSLVIIGDVGPYENINRRAINDLRLPTPLNRSYEASGYELIRHFKSQSEQNLVLTIYTGSASSNPPTRWVEYSKPFFCNLAKTAGAQGRFTDSRAKMVWELLETFLRDEVVKEEELKC